MDDDARLKKIKAKAKKEGWLHYIVTKSDEQAVLDGCYFDFEAAEHVCYFFENFLRLSKSRDPGQPFTLLDFQRYEILYPLFGWMRADGNRRFNRGYIEMPKKNAKALCLDTKVPTPSGFKTIEEVRPGDYVFGVDGKQTLVTNESEIFIDRECYEFEFSNGEKIVSDGDHLWEVNSHNWRRGGLFKTLTSKEVFSYFANSKSPLIRTRKASATTLEEKNLPIDPYIFGYWLGDGSSSTALVHCGAEDVESFKDELLKVNYSFKEHKRGNNYCLQVRGDKNFALCTRGHDLEVFGKLRFDKQRGKEYIRCIKCEALNAKGANSKPFNLSMSHNLRLLGVLNNKHVPELYLFSSRNQRISLLQGLMDSDGTCSKSSQLTFTNCNERLARNVFSLVRSLGFKANFRSAPAKLYGRTVGTVYSVSFFAEEICFRLKRKALRQSRKLHADRQNWIYIRAVRKVESRPTKCITVASKDGLFLVGDAYITTHNSTIAAGIGNYMLLGDGERSSEVYCAANDKGQAKIVWDIAADMIETSPVLLEQVRDVLYSTSRIVKDNTSWFSAWSSDRSSKDGPIAHCVICDELHEWSGEQGADFFNKIKFAGRARRQPLCPLVITTAGSNRYGICYDQHQYAKKVLNGTIIDKQFFALIYAADEEKLRNDPDYWKSHEARKAANPGLGTILTEDDFLSDIAECENNPTALSAFLRYRLNQWVQAENPWMDLNVWRRNIGTVDEAELLGKECYAGLDLASTNDTTSYVLVFPIREKPNGKIISAKVLPRIFIPEDSAYEAVKKNVVQYDVWIRDKKIFTTPGDCIDYDFVQAQLEKDLQAFDVRELAYDRFLSVNIIPFLQNNYPNLSLVPFGQGWVSMSEPIKALYTWLSNAKIEHAGHEPLEWMAGNAVAEYDPRENITLSKRKSTGKIDGIIALIMGFARMLLTDVESKPAASIYNNPDFEKKFKELFA